MAVCSAMHRWVVLFALAACIAGCGGAQHSVTTTVVQTVTTVTSPAATTSSSTTTPTTSTQPAPPQSYGTYSAPDYTLDIPAGWTTVEDQAKTPGYVESKWRAPASQKTSILVDSQPSSGLSAEEDAASVRAQTSPTRATKRSPSNPHRSPEATGGNGSSRSPAPNESITSSTPAVPRLRSSARPRRSVSISSAARSSTSRIRFWVGVGPRSAASVQVSRVRPAQDWQSRRACAPFHTRRSRACPGYSRSRDTKHSSPCLTPTIPSPSNATPPSPSWLSVNTCRQVSARSSGSSRIPAVDHPSRPG